MGQIKPLKVDRSIIIYAFRYALGRMTFAPIEVIENIKLNFDNISTSDLEIFIKEIRNCNNYGMDCDMKQWLKFANDLENEIKRRKFNESNRIN